MSLGVKRNSWELSMLWIRLFTQLSSMAANALSAPQKRKHLPWQRSQHQTLLKRSRSRLQSLGTHSLGTECHFIEGMNITRVIRTTTQWILHLVCQEHPEKHSHVLGVCNKGSTNNLLPLRCVDMLWLHSHSLCDQQNLYSFHIHFPMDNKRWQIPFCNPWPFLNSTVSRAAP